MEPNEATPVKASKIAKHPVRLAAIALACAGQLAVTTSPLPAQPPPAAATDNSPTPLDLRFETASIRPGEGRSNGSLQPYSPGRYRDQDIILATLVWKAFQIKHSYQIEYPGWMSSAYFTVNATLPEGATKADLPIMIQHLLEDRFALKLHHQSRLMRGYRLVVAKPAPGLTKSAAPTPDQPRATGPQIEMKNGMPQFGKDARSGELWIGTSVQWRGRNETMEKVAASLADKLGAPVLDATGLEGGYDFTLLYTAEPTSANGAILSAPPPVAPASTSAAGSAPAPPEHPLLHDALEEQLGLELKPLKEVPVDVIVIDSANKQPTEN